jgi:CheY-like chemotaxis protein
MSAEPGTRRVLVVDDSATIRKVVATVLSRAGYEVGQAGDGAQALVVLKRERWSLALVDFVMPRINGYELCRKLREDPALRELPVVLMSAKADKIREHFLRQTGAIDAITKPFDPRALLLAVDAAFTKAEGGRGRRPEGDGTESSDSGHGELARPAVPEAFLRRLGDVLARLVPDLPRDVDPNGILVHLRRVLGEQGIAALYGDLVGATAGAALAGDFGAIPLAEVLQLLQLQRQTGVLTIYNAATEVQVAMRDGLIDVATSRGTADEFRLGRYLVETGKLDRDQLDALLVRDRESSRRRLLGDLLIDEQLITREDLDSALARQTS